ncbi:glycosyl transferase family 2 [Desulfurobacterium thermolithotrophum DSM 11699]|uniref:Glycosyl transferase family 2 n=1 Tax=Desulfurobacterium thermolithotrophum (strain DSM 11699 / BSA) TaxID=868864 RepID=F0S148_DESTD|nr:glycosyltransferase [Desulfurobacterium thermolithotrophum]ADY73926.1 glycosyl transferase family 2 [Desulfurobacterium thermolithotrophum DSM 11699]
MEEKVSVLVVTNKEFNGDLLDSLEENKEYIKEIIFSGKETEIPHEFKELSVPVKFLNIESNNKAILRNKLAETASSEFLLFLNSGCSLEDSTIEELLEEMEETNADIVYPNLIIQFSGEESIKNYHDLYGKEVDLVKSLSAEEFLPEWGILVKKSSLIFLNYFNENFADYEFYEFIYRNLRKLKLRLSEFSYVNQTIYDSFIDTSYRSYVVRELILKNFDWKTEIFPFLSWDEKPEIAEATALTIVGERLVHYYDYFNATDYYRRALLTFHNQETLRQLVKTYIDMGLFDEARKLITDLQGVSKKDQEEMTFYIDKISSLIEELEKAVEEGKLVEVITAIQEVTNFYSGAPIYNILGVIKWIQKEFDEAYKFFYKAVTMNPLSKDYLYNLIGMAKETGREKEVKGLIERLVNSLNN